MVEVRVPNMVEKRYRGRGFLGSGIGSSMHTKIEQDGWRMEM